MNTFSKLGLLASLYFSQGLPYGFFTQALPVLLRQQGVSLPAIGLSTLLTLPWALKFLWAPLIDSVSHPGLGRYRSWILPLQATAIGLVLAISGLDVRSQMPYLMVGILLANLLAATQDIATDGLAIGLLTDEERGPGNGVQVAGYRVGMIVGGGAMLIFFDRVGWNATFLTMAMLLLVASLPILLHRETSVMKAPAPGFGSIRTFFSQHGMAPWLLMLSLFKFAEAFGNAMIKPFLVDHGITLTEIGWILGTFGFTAGLAGALFGGFGVTVLGRQRSLITFGFLQVVGLSAYVLPAAGFTDPWILYAACTLEHFTSGAATASLFTLNMDICRQESAGTDYTCQASVVVISTSLAGSLSGVSAQALGYLHHFLLSTALSAVSLLICAECLSRATRMELFDRKR